MLSYLYSQIETYGLGHIPVKYGGQSRDAVLQECRDITQRIAESLFGPKWRSMHLNAGMTRETVWHVTGYRENAKTPVHLRLCQLVLLQHINGIRQHLSDLERDLWVALQLTHSKVLVPKIGKSTQEMAEMRAKIKIRAAIGNPRRAKKVKVDQHTKMMPVRALALIKHPDVEPIQALRRELEKLPRGRLLDKLSEGAR